ncbi:hypothetical protein PIROE2DRAFT_4225, partial [Piromyces sp. E2]
VLLANDQLKIEINKGNAFNTFSEAPITFRPTYKFDVYTKTYAPMTPIAPTAPMAPIAPMAPMDTPINSEITSEYAKSSTIDSPPDNANKTSAILTTSPNIDIFDSTTTTGTPKNEMNQKHWKEGDESKPLKNENGKENMPPNNGIGIGMNGGYDTTIATTTTTTTPLSKPIELKNVYDTSKKARIPSWTDRILFRVRNQKPLSAVLLESSSNNNHNTSHQTQYNNMNSIRIPLKPVLVEKYTSCENMHWSDHKPVIGSFRIENDWSCDDAVNNKVVHRKTNKNACIIQ